MKDESTLGYIHITRREYDFEPVTLTGVLNHANMVLFFSFKCFIKCASKLLKDNKLLLHLGNLKEDHVKMIFVLNM